MGEHITIGQSLIITVFSMMVVFAVLFIISYIIKAMRTSLNMKKNDSKKGINEPSFAETELKDNKEEVASNNVEDEELVAVIAAAVAASLGVSIPEINIKSIRRVNQNTPTWAKMGIIEQTTGRL